MRKYISLLALVLTSWQSHAQINQRDSVLANERTLDRPINVHGGQLRISAGYGLNSVTHRYAADGAVTMLKEGGFAYARHKSYAEIKFGITEHLQLTTSAWRQNSLVRDQEIFLVGFPTVDNVTDIYETERVGGFEDIYVGLDFRIPFKSRKFDLLISAGSFIPTAKSITPQPDHTLEVNEAEDWEIVYRNFSVPGNGAPVGGIGASFKYRFKNTGFTLSGMHYHGFNKEVDDQDWIWQLTSKEQFEYKSIAYKRGIPDRLNLMAYFEVQLSPYFQLFLFGEYISATKGWRQWEDGVIDHQNFTSVTAGPGFELIITPRLWFRETVTFPLQGESMDNGIQFLSALSYNIFVKH